MILSTENTYMYIRTTRENRLKQLQGISNQRRSSSIANTTEHLYQFITMCQTWGTAYRFFLLSKLIAYPAHATDDTERGTGKIRLSDTLIGTGFSSLNAKFQRYYFFDGGYIFCFVFATNTGFLYATKEKSRSVHRNGFSDN